MMKFLDLVHREQDELAELLAREHGKTIADAKGDIQRGYEVVEFGCGIPHLLKGEFTDGAGPGHRRLFDAPAARRHGRHHAVQLPRHDPDVEVRARRSPAATAFILKPSERDPGVPMRLAELMIEAGLPAGVLNVVNGDKVAVDALLDDPDVKAIGFVGSTPDRRIHLCARRRQGKRVHAFGGAKNHMVIMPDADMDKTVDALIGAGYGSAGQRCMAISVAVPVGKGTADTLMEKLVPRVEALKIGPSTDASRRLRPARHPGGRRQGPQVCRHRHQGRRRPRRSTGAASRCRATRRASTSAPACSTTSPRTCGSTRRRSSGRCCRCVRAKTYEEASALCNDHEYGNGIAIFTRDGDAARDFVSKVQVGMVGVNVPIPTPLAYYSFGGWKRSVFGDLNQHGPDSVRFYTKTKNVTARWPSGVKEGAEFSMPTM